MEKGDVDSAAADVIVVAVVTTMPPLRTTTITVDHDDSDIVVAVVVARILRSCKKMKFGLVVVYSSVFTFSFKLLCH